MHSLFFFMSIDVVVDDDDGVNSGPTFHLRDIYDSLFLSIHARFVNNSRMRRVIVDTQEFYIYILFVCSLK